MRTRLTDLAEQAGVSTATVSRVLNGKPGVSAQARQTVLTALDILGYERPEKLRMRSAGLVGLVVPELTNPVFPAFAQVIETMLSDRGYTPLLCTQSPGGTTEDQYVELLMDHGVDGIVFVSGLHADTAASKDRYHRLRGRGVPIVLVNGYAEGVDAPTVSTDDTAAMDQAFRHVYSLGHRSIGLALGPPRFVPSQRKRAAFTSLVEKHLGATDADAHVVSTLFTVEGGHAAATELFASGHTAVICGSDLMALGAVRAARTLGLRVPDDVSVVGFDDSPLIAFTDPPLTTVRQPVTAMGHAAVAALVAEISGSSATRAELLFHPELIVRGSTGSAPVPVPVPVPAPAVSMPDGVPAVS
ncbi:LacI family DNA-binding transcriptional regulator [Cellulomonas dongxiuzhuiae]|uniref:LacI family transcriptional regulator n=1 Tax=Cellulomonas dongxiuzhuiae TaxID=2819979 RepID=A0ABX8GGN6_9CELL|nr:LacI family DNA-binding transcriptional regulator [Cellulomonas dongxiuzhuiae]MBO3086867.1 LacI family DNA-binding transcriptional regulator [Cellulomonas dongxiuzhuiae]MBO3093781.1 LacI family DNA-binding transcriptional regulator [Cellulomonas dongxiuzhuiae]QWC14887.1 LacI family transcriptional regulator [Cellulomonas dongxiuzhuiae]